MVPPKLTMVAHDAEPDERREEGAASELGGDPSEVLAHEGWRGLPPNIAQLPSAARIPSNALIASGNQNECSSATALLKSSLTAGVQEVSNFTLALPI